MNSNRAERMMVKSKETLEARLRDFVQENSGGWGHDQWESLLGALEAEGHDVSQPEGIGRELERLRLGVRLEELDVKGLGPKRKEGLMESFGNLWQLRQASVEELAAVPALNRAVARALHEELR